MRTTPEPDRSKPASRAADALSWLTAWTSWRWWVVVLVAWTAFGVLMVGHVIVRYEQQRTFVQQLQSIVPFYWAWIPVTPLIGWLGSRFDFATGQRLESVAAHALGGVSVAAVQILLYSTYAWLVPNCCEAGGWGWTVLRSVRRHSVGDFATYAFIAAAVVAAQLYTRARERDRVAKEAELHASRLEAQLSTARLDALQMQLSPHFLFNALNSVSVLVLKESNHAAIRAIRQLGDLLRGALAAGSAHERSLNAELAFVAEYLEIERLRFGEKLVVEFRADTESRAAMVPYFLLQPLVENAVVHGLAPAGNAGTICISAARTNGIVRLEVRDSGVGLGPTGRATETGVGLANTRARLRELYGEAGRLTVNPAIGGGTVATIELPYAVTPAVSIGSS